MWIQRKNVSSVDNMEVKAIFVGNCCVEWQSILLSRYVALEKCDTKSRVSGPPPGSSGILQSSYGLGSQRS